MRAFKDIGKPILFKTQLRIIRHTPSHVTMALATVTARIVWLYELVALGFFPLLVVHVFVVVDQGEKINVPMSFFAMRQVGNFNEGYLIAPNSAKCLPVSD